MKKAWFVQWIGGVLLALVGFAEAQTSNVPATPAPAPSTTGSGAAGNGVAVIILVAAIVIVLVAIAKFIDLRRKRTAEAVALEAQVSDALLRDRNFVGRSVTPTVHLPFWRRSPATLKLTGQVPDRQLRQLAVRIAEQEASRVRSDVRIDDQIGETPYAPGRAA